MVDNDNMHFGLLFITLRFSLSGNCSKAPSIPSASFTRRLRVSSLSSAATSACTSSSPAPAGVARSPLRRAWRPITLSLASRIQDEAKLLHQPDKSPSREASSSRKASRNRQLLRAHCFYEVYPTHGILRHRPRGESSARGRWGVTAEAQLLHALEVRRGAGWLERRESCAVAHNGVTTRMF